MVCAIRLNGKQVKHLCCPRNGKQVWTHQYATVSISLQGILWEGDAFCLASPYIGLECRDSPRKLWVIS